MFGLLVAGRLVQTDFLQVGEKQFLATVANADQMHHMAVFLTGIQPFPADMGGLVYFSYPEPGGPPAWRLLGSITNDKPSSILRVSGAVNTLGTAALNPDGTPLIFHGAVAPLPVHAQVGIQVDSIASIQQQCVNIGGLGLTDAGHVPAITQARRMLEHFVNFAGSYAITQAQMRPQPEESFIPLSTLSAWAAAFEKRLIADPDFWRA